MVFGVVAGPRTCSSYGWRPEKERTPCASTTDSFSAQRRSRRQGNGGIGRGMPTVLCIFQTSDGVSGVVWTGTVGSSNGLCGGRMLESVFRGSSVQSVSVVCGCFVCGGSAFHLQYSTGLVIAS